MTKKFHGNIFFRIYTSPDIRRHVFSSLRANMPSSGLWTRMVMGYFLFASHQREKYNTILGSKQDRRADLSQNVLYLLPPQRVSSQNKIPLELPLVCFDTIP